MNTNRITISPGGECFDRGATAAAKFFVGILVLQYLPMLLQSGLEQTVIALVGSLVILLLGYLFASSFYYIIRTLYAILRSPILPVEIDWKTLIR